MFFDMPNLGKSKIFGTLLAIFGERCGIDSKRGEDNFGEAPGEKYLFLAKLFIEGTCTRYSPLLL